MRRRTKPELFMEVLRNVIKEVKITYIVYEIRTNHTYVRDALDLLIKKGFVKNTDEKHYLITNKGLKFLEDYDNFIKKWKFPLINQT